MYYKPYLGAVATGLSINRYTMLWDGQWWACLKGGQHHLIYEGDGYERICQTDFFGQEGTQVLGIVKIYSIRNLAVYHSEFLYVKEEILAAFALMNYEYKQLFDDKVYPKNSINSIVKKC